MRYMSYPSLFVASVLVLLVALVEHVTTHLRKWSRFLRGLTWYRKPEFCAAVVSMVALLLVLVVALVNQHWVMS